VGEQEVHVQELLNVNFDCQQGMFKFTIRSNVVACMVPPFDTNLLMMMWHLVTTS
jgi:hypothetical protein